RVEHFGEDRGVGDSEPDLDRAVRQPAPGVLYRVGHHLVQGHDGGVGGRIAGQGLTGELTRPGRRPRAAGEDDGGHHLSASAAAWAARPDRTAEVTSARTLQPSRTWI